MKYSRKLLLLAAACSLTTACHIAIPLTAGAVVGVLSGVEKFDVDLLNEYLYLRGLKAAPIASANSCTASNPKGN